MTTKILVFGATGLMMSHILPYLIKKHSFSVTAYVRPSSTGKAFLEREGISTIEGEWDDAELIKKSVKGFNIVWDAGDSHDPSLPKLLLPILLEAREDITFIRYTGTGNWITQTGGTADPSAKTYDDNKAEDIASLTDEHFNGAGDRLTLQAIEKGLNAWLLCTGGVYAVPADDTTSLGVFVRLYTANALQLGYTPYIGPGDSHMQLISIQDVISATDIFLQQVLPTVGKPSAKDGDVVPHSRYFNAPGYSYTWKSLAETWSKVLAKTHGKDLAPKQVEGEAAGFIYPLINAEMKSKASKLEALGWAPNGPSIENVLESILVKDASANQ